MHLTFALSGIGEAWIDDVTVHVLQPGTPTAAAPGRGLFGFGR